MLSAQKQEMPSHTPPEGSRPPATTGFGKVLNSIQGLQQRLDDFSVEEVSRAHAQAHELIRELGDLQAQLEALAKLKVALASNAAQITAIPEPDFDYVAPDTWEKHPQLRAIMQTAKRIHMQRLWHSGQQSQASSASEIKTAPTGFPATNVMESLPENPGAARLERIVAEAQAVTPTAHEPQALQAADTAPGRNPKPSRVYEFSELKLEEARQSSPLPKKDSPQPAVSGSNHTPSRKSKKAKGKTHFDQRLLNDLIETYGEFAIPTKSADRSERSEAASTGPGQIEPAKTSPIAEQSTSLALPTVQSSSVDTPAIVPIPVEPAFVHTGSHEMLSLPGPVEESVGPSFDEALASAKSRGEIDRQLKSIIKDYGQVDLYSHQPSHNLKPVIIAAVAALTLLLGAIYFFKSSSPPAPAAIEATIPANEIQDPSAKNIKQKN